MKIDMSPTNCYLNSKGVKDQTESDLGNISRNGAILFGFTTHRYCSLFSLLPIAVIPPPDGDGRVFEL